jgi:hypothetical protein
MGMVRLPNVFRGWQSTLRLVICLLMLIGCYTADVAWGQSQGSSEEPMPGDVSTETVGQASEAGPKGDGGRRPASEQSTSIYTNSEPLHQAYLRAAIEISAFLGISAAYYYETLGDRKDYEFGIGADSLYHRFVTGDAILLDNNPWDSNVGHVAAGTGYYLLARTNDLSLFGSFFASLGASTIWEFFGELQDEVSINDAVMTPFGGFAIGEAYYQLGEFFQHSSDTIPNRALGFLFGPSAVFHRWLDNTTPKPPANVDKFGFTTDAWHRFRLFAGYGGSYSHDTDRSRSETEMGFDFEVSNVEKYGKPGEASTFYKDGAFNELAFQAAMDGSDVVDFRFMAKTVFLGHYEQNVSRNEVSQALEGYSLFYGLSSAFEYYSHTFSEMEQDDKQTVCDLLGPALIADYYHGGFHLRAAVDVYPTFSMVQPAAGDVYSGSHSLAGVKSVFGFEQYYYALGVAGGGRVEADYGPWGIEGQVRYHYFNSIEGLDRWQEKHGVYGPVDSDINLEDQRLWLNLALYYKLPIDCLKLALNVENIYRSSEIADFSLYMDETRFLGRLIFEF